LDLLRANIDEGIERLKSYLSYSQALIILDEALIILDDRDQMDQLALIILDEALIILDDRDQMDQFGNTSL